MGGLNEHWERNAGNYGWAITLSTVAVLDIVLPQTLSSAADRMLEDKRTAWLPWVMGGIIAGHVLNVIPRHLDPIQRLGDAVAERMR